MKIAIDFDDTITEISPYPITGKVREDAKLYIKKLWDDGHTLILWTSRGGKYLDEAIDVLHESGLLPYFSFINDDGSQIQKSRKINADFYIDDRSMFTEIVWEDWYNYIKNKSEELK